MFVISKDVRFGQCEESIVNSRDEDDGSHIEIRNISKMLLLIRLCRTSQADEEITS